MSAPTQFLKKPVVISAIQWTGENLVDVIHFTDGRPPNNKSSHAGMMWDQYVDLVRKDGLKIFTMEGKMDASIGDWIIKGVKGEHYPCKPEIFALTYEDVSAGTDLSQASVAAALEAAATGLDNEAAALDADALRFRGGSDANYTRQVKAHTARMYAGNIRALITPAQHDALAAHVAAEVAKARAEDAAVLAESQAYGLAIQEELRVRMAKLERECKLTQAQVDRMLVNSTQTHADLAGCKIALEQAWASNRERAAKITALTDALTELHAMVIGECPSLLNEDSGGNGELSCQINDLLTGEMTMKTAAGKAADVLLEHIVYYDLAERRGTEIADAVIAELVEIGVKSAQIGAKP